MIRAREWRLFALRDGLRLAAFSPRCGARVAGLPVAFPRRVGLFLTDRCNFRCPMCAVREARQGGADMPGEYARRVLAECGAHGAVADLIGGEPLLYGDLDGLLALAARHRALTAITTNGLLLETRAATLVNGRLPILQVSLDGWDETSQVLRGGVRGSFTRILAGVRAVAGRGFPVVRVLTTITRQNYAWLDRIQEVVASLGVRYWALTNYFFLSAAAARAHRAFAAAHGLDGPVAAHALEGDTYLDREQVAALKQSLARIRRRTLGLRVTYAWDIDLDGYYSTAAPSPRCRCGVPYERLDVHPDGRITACVGGKTLGNLERDSLAGVWRGAGLARYRQEYERHRPMPMCFRCCGISQDIRF